MKLDQQQIRLLVNLQGSLEQKEVKFLVFHEDQTYTITNEVEDALNTNSTIFVITSNHVVALGPVLAETKEDIKEQVNMILSVVQNEQMKTKDSTEDIKIPLIEHPTYTVDLFTVIAYELEYGVEEMDNLLSILKKMQSIYTEYFQKNRTDDVTELSFVAEKILLKMNKSQKAIDLFIDILKEKVHLPQGEIEGQATVLLTNLLFENINNK